MADHTLRLEKFTPEEIEEVQGQVKKGCRTPPPCLVCAGVDLLAEALLDSHGVIGPDQVPLTALLTTRRDQILEAIGPGLAHEIFTQAYNDCIDIAKSGAITEYASVADWFLGGKSDQAITSEAERGAAQEFTS